jgi:hypothetical protein
MSRLLTLVGIIGFIAAPLATPLHAWSERSTERIARKGSELAPPDMKLLIDKFSSDFRRGLAEAASDPSTKARHTYVVASGRGSLPRELQNEVRTAIAMVKGRQPMSAFVEKLGVIAHLVSDANNPFNVANSEVRLLSSRSDYEGYFERKVTKFPTVFYGLDPQFQLDAYLDASMKRTAALYPLLSEEYFRGGQRRSSSEFDDRSTAFGIASVCYSRAVTDLVNIYYHIWKEAGGDVRTAPTLRRGNLLIND